MAPTPESESLFERLKAWDAEAVAVELSKDPSLWSAAARKDVRLGSRQEVAWMLGEVAPTPLSVAVRLARKDDRKKGAEMVRKMLEVLETQTDSYWKRTIYPAVTTPLHEAMFYGLTEIALLLVKAGFRPDAPNKLNFTPMDVAEEPAIGQKVLAVWKGKGDSILALEEFEEDGVTESDNSSSAGFRSSSSISYLENATSQVSLYSTISETAPVMADDEPVLAEPEIEVVAPEPEITPVQEDIVEETPAEPVEIPAEEVKPLEPAIAEEPPALMATEPLVEPEVAMDTVAPASPQKELKQRITPQTSPTKVSSGSSDKGMALFGKRQQASTAWTGNNAPAMDSIPLSSERSQMKTSASAAADGADRGLSLFAARRKKIEEAAAGQNESAPIIAAVSIQPRPPVAPVVAAAKAKPWKPTVAPAKETARTASLIFSTKDIPAEPPAVLAPAKAIEPVEVAKPEPAAETPATPYTPTTTVEETTESFKVDKLHTGLSDDFSSVIKMSGVMAFLGESQPDFVAPEIEAVDAKDGGMQEKKDSMFEVEEPSDVRLEKTESAMSFQADEMWASAALASQLPPLIPLKSTPSKRSMAPKIDTSQRGLREVAATNSSSSTHSGQGSLSSPYPGPATSVESASGSGLPPAAPPNTPAAEQPLTSLEMALQLSELDAMIQNLPSSSPDSSSVPTTPSSMSFSLPPIAPPNTPTTITPGSAFPTKRTLETPPNTPTVVTPIPLPSSGLLGGVLTALQMPDLSSFAGSQSSSASQSPAKSAPKLTAIPETDAPSLEMPQISLDGRLGLDYEDLYVATNALFALSQIFPDQPAIQENTQNETVIKYTALSPEQEAKKRLLEEKEELARILESGVGTFVAEFERCEFPSVLPESSMLPVEFWVTITSDRAEHATERHTLNRDNISKGVDFMHANEDGLSGFSLPTNANVALQVTMHVEPVGGQKIKVLTPEEAHAEAEKLRPGSMAPPLPPRRDSAMNREASSASLYGGMSHSVSQASSLGALSHDVRSEYAGSESTFARSRGSNGSSASIAGSIIMTDTEGLGVVLACVPLQSERYVSKPAGIVALRAGLPSNVLVERVVEHVPAAPKPPTAVAPPEMKRAPSLLGRLGLGRKNSTKQQPKPNAFARFPSTGQLPAVLMTRRAACSIQGVVTFSAVWIPGDHGYENPANFTEVEVWLGKLHATNGEALEYLLSEGASCTLRDGGEYDVPAWVRTVGLMKKHGMLSV